MSLQYKKVIIISIVVAVILAIVAAGVFMWARGAGRSSLADESTMPREYRYESRASANGMELHAIRVRPSNVAPESVRNNVVAAPYYGINGGFFYEDALLSIAVANDVPVHKNGGRIRLRRGEREVRERHAGMGRRDG